MRIFTNNAVTTLLNGISNSALSLQVASGEGTKFPSPTGGDFFTITLCKLIGVTESAIEIVHCTGRSGDVFTIVRAQEGTAGVAHDAGDSVQLRVTAASHNDPTVNTLVSKGTVTAPNFTGLASSATVLATPRAIALNGDVSGTANFDGSAPISITSTLSAGQVATIAAKEIASNKDATGGYAGLTLFKLNMRNVSNTITSWFTNTATAARTWTLPDASGTVALTSDITATAVGLGSVDNTADAGKPVSTAQQTALNLKANLASPIFTGTPTLPAGTISTELTGSVSNTVAAAGTTQSTATAITSDTTVVTTGTGGVVLPVPVVAKSQCKIIINKTGAAVNVYPGTSCLIDAMAVNTAISVPADGFIELFSSSATQWYSSKNAVVAGGTGTLTNVTSSRALATTYTNTGTTTRWVMVATTVPTGSGQVQLYAGVGAESSGGGFEMREAGAVMQIQSLTFPVPPSVTYKAGVTSGILQQWFEYQ